MMHPKTAMIFAHPGHEVTVLGMIQRYRPAILFLTKADSGGSKDREAMVNQGLGLLDGVTESVTFLGLSEMESYGHAFAGNVDYYAAYRDRITSWLRDTQPEQIFGDAFEVYNFHHDLTRLLIDGAVRELREEGADITNYETPLCCRTEADINALRYQCFPTGPFQRFTLNADEIASKHLVANQLGSRYGYVAGILGKFRADGEVYRPVPTARDYSISPSGLRRHYDDWGREMVRRGKYTTSLTFEEHFVPLAHGLGMTTAGSDRRRTENARHLLSPMPTRRAG